MSSANNSVVSEYSSDTTNINLKLRRLKIEENVISKSIRITSEDFQEDNFSFHEHYSDTETKSYFRNLKDSLSEVNTLFEDIKSHTNSQCNLEIVGKCYFVKCIALKNVYNILS